ncbi:MAG: fatty acid desaturase [Pelagimonas sp.]|jgi:fatty acid desaturase|nr:fatty acid desaturase [Pelagimonas sp.]
MDHKTFMASLPPKDLARLSQRSDAKGLRHLALHLGAICALGLWIALGGPLWWALIPVQGVLIVFLFTLEHECTHQTPFANTRLNEAVGHLCGFLLLLPFLWFRYFHLAHHRWTNLPGKDPELDSPKPTSWGAWIKHVSGLPMWVSLMRQLIVNAMGRAKAPYLPDRALPRITFEARVLLVLYALAALSLMVSPLLFWVWILPALVGQPFLRLYLLAEHGRCPEVANMFDNTRTTFTNRVLRFLAWNMPYHVEHHTAPNVPFHQLPALHQRIQTHLKHTENGYARFTAKWIGDL